MIDRSKINDPLLSTSVSFWRIGLVILDLLCVVADYRSGPYLPLTLAYVMLTYLATTKVEARLGYFIAMLSAAGRTYSETQSFPSEDYLLFSLWQFATSASVYVLFCYLLGLHMPDRNRKEKTPSTEGSTPGIVGAANANRDLKISYTAIFIIAVLACFGALSPVTYGKATSGEYSFDVPTSKVVQNSSRKTPVSLDGAPSSKVLLLTIDDGPRDAQVDRKILDTLKKHSTKTIWFVNCKNFDASENPDAVQNRDVLMEILTDGNLLGNHGYHHLNLKVLDLADRDQLSAEIEQCSNLIEATVGKRPRYFRAPWGDTTPNVLQIVAKSGMTNMPWNASYDSNFGFPRRSDSTPNTRVDPKLLELRLTQFIGSLKSGDIILMHDNAQTAESLDDFLSRLEKLRFHFVVPT